MERTQANEDSTVELDMSTMRELAKKQPAAHKETLPQHDPSAAAPEKDSV
jgi:hypothetical protein